MDFTTQIYFSKFYNSTFIIVQNLLFNVLIFAHFIITLVTKQLYFIFLLKKI